MSLDDTIVDTPEGPMTFKEWKKKNPVQLPSRRTKGKDLPNKVKTRTGSDLPVLPARGRTYGRRSHTAYTPASTASTGTP
ncbi:hypothetical protein MOP88_05300 [Sphingomonas sp. WKB10]|nr:hypothetical protein [Sphingomonas sp. WKB10]